MAMVKKIIHVLFVVIVGFFLVSCVIAVGFWFGHWLSQAASFL